MTAVVRLATLVLLSFPALAAAQGLPRTTPERAGMSAQRLARLDSVMQANVRSGRYAGIVTLVARRGRIVHLGAYGRRDDGAGAAMTPDAIFRIASQTKALTSVAAMILVEEGRLLLSDPVSKYIPGFAKTTVAVEEGEGSARAAREVPSRRQITVRDLLTHTAGISYGGGPFGQRYRDADLEGWYFADEDEAVSQTLAALPTLPQAAHPGERWVYGYATDLLGVVVERASGLSLDDFFRRRIIEPLGMKDTHFYLPTEKAGRLAAVYLYADSSGLRRAGADGATGQGAYVNGPRKAFSGGAGLVSTATDYARFLQMLLNGGELDGRRILSPASVRLMTNDAVGELYTSPGLGFGFGFEVLEEPGLAGRMGSPGAWGWGGAYHSHYWVDPQEELVAVFLTQIFPGNDLHPRFRNLVYQSIVAPARRGGSPSSARGGTRR